MTTPYRRTHTCGALRKTDLHSSVRLSGWVNRRRDHGGLIFVDLRDRFGITQLVFDPKINPQAHALADSLRQEWVICVHGKVIARSEGMANPKLATGDIEIEVDNLHILSKAKTPPFSICDEEVDVNEELRLKHRFLDIRRGKILSHLLLRDKALLVVRNFLNEQGFTDVATPLLAKSTPEGSRDYLVPSRIYPGSFYALPQSPQLFKQVLMVSGLDRYFQIAPCMRDEDLRADRQPEFYQIDMEMSFGTPQEDLFPCIEGLMQTLFKQVLNVDLPKKFRQLSYHECIENYGTDKPDLRFGMPLIDVSDIAQHSTFSVFLDVLSQKGIVKGLCVKQGASLSRRQIDDYTKFVSLLGIKGLAWMKFSEGALNSNIVKFFSPEQQKALIEKFKAQEGDLLFFIADEKNKTNQGLDHLRRHLARELKLVSADHFEFLWVTDFPLFAWNAEEGRIEAEHHPFTSPLPSDFHMLETEPLKVRSSSYDLVLNGYELASGSQRIHDPELQKKMFELLRLSEEEIQNKFGFFVDALSYGTPPHLGAAIGVERLVMLLAKTEQIRDVVAFPKTQKATDLMTQAPSLVLEQQLEELGLRVKPVKEKAIR